MSVSINIIKDIILLTKDGWRPYNNQPQASVYADLNCDKYKRIKPNWFVKGDKYICLGCSNRCALQRPEGFQLPLPIKYPNTHKIREITLTPEELVDCKHTLQVREVCYCLNISTQKAYGLVNEGRLTALKEKPVRVLASEVKQMMNDLDE